MFTKLGIAIATNTVIAAVGGFVTGIGTVWAAKKIAEKQQAEQKHAHSR